jgi:hypothetical protein
MRGDRLAASVYHLSPWLTPSPSPSRGVGATFETNQALMAWGEAAPASISFPAKQEAP